MKQGQWSNNSTFQKFYKKEIIDHSESIQASILSNVLWREVVTALISSFKYKRWVCPDNFHAVKFRIM